MVVSISAHWQRRINSTKSPVSCRRIFAIIGKCHKAGDARVRVDQCVSAFRAVEVPVLVCLRRSCNHVTEVGGPYDL
jgi:hypothetical protein